MVLISTPAAQRIVRRLVAKEICKRFDTGNIFFEADMQKRNLGRLVGRHCRQIHRAFDETI